MPGSTTIGHTERLVMLSHDDAVRLAAMLARMSAMADPSSPTAMSEAQIADLCGGDAHQEAAFATWTGKLAAYVRAHL